MYMNTLKVGYTSKAHRFTSKLVSQMWVTSPVTNTNKISRILVVAPNGALPGNFFRKYWDLSYRHIYLGHPLKLKGVGANIILGDFIRLGWGLTLLFDAAVVDAAIVDAAIVFVVAVLAATAAVAVAVAAATVAAVDAVISSAGFCWSSTVGSMSLRETFSLITSGFFIGEQVGLPCSFFFLGEQRRRLPCSNATTGVLPKYWTNFSSGCCM